MTRKDSANGRVSVGGLRLLGLVSVKVAFALMIIVALASEHPDPLITPEADKVLGFVAAGLMLLASYTALGGLLARHLRRSRRISGLLETVLHTSQEWLWAVDGQGKFTFSSPASATLLGYHPSELIGRHCSLVINPGELADALQAVAAGIPNDACSSWSGAIVSCRHRSGAPVRMEVSSRARRRSRIGPGAGFECTSRLMPPAQIAERLLKKRVRERIDAALRDGMILTEFQPIHELETGDIIGVEALTRFPGGDGQSPECWFKEAATVGLGADLEFAALESALDAAPGLPAHLYLALNISPETCIDPRLPAVLEQTELALDRMVLELTEHHAVDDYASLHRALFPLRQRGLRIAIDDAGAGYSSMRHILQLRPEIIKLDRSLIAGIAEDTAHRALGAAMVEFARKIDAHIIAEGIETREQLEAATELAMTAGQGYFLGRPSTLAKGWAPRTALPATS